MSKMKTSPICYSVYVEGDNPIFGDSATHIKMEDDFGGAFVVLEQLAEEGTMKIKLDFDEVDDIFNAIKKLEEYSKYSKEEK